MVRICCQIDEETDEYFKSEYDRLALSPRAHDRILRVARTVADMDEREKIEKDDVIEALALRKFTFIFFE